MRGCADFIRQDKADAGKGYGAFSMWRSFAWILRTVRSVSETCRGRTENEKIDFYENVYRNQEK